MWHTGPFCKAVRSSPCRKLSPWEVIPLAYFRSTCGPCGLVLTVYSGYEGSLFNGPMADVSHPPGLGYGMGAGSDRQERRLSVAVARSMQFSAATFAST